MEGSIMGQILHGSATTTAAVRRAIQHSQESLMVLAKRYDIKPKTICQMARAAIGGRLQDWSSQSSFNRSQH